MMRRIFFLISVWLMSFALYSQTENIKAQEYYYSGMDKVLKNNRAGAIAHFSEAIKHDSGFIEAYENRGVAKFYLQDQSGAIDDYNKALELNPDDYNTYVRIGWAKFNLRDYTGAIADFNTVINSWYSGKYQKSEAFFWRGPVKIDMGQKDSGCLDLSKAWKLGYARAYEAIKGYCL